MAIQTTHGSALLTQLLVDEASHIEMPNNAADDLRTYITSLNAHLQPYLREGKSLNSVGAQLVDGAAIFLILFASESQQQQIAIDTEVWSLEDAAVTCAEHLRGQNIEDKLLNFIADVRRTDGKAPVVLIADNGLMFYRPRYDERQSTYDVSAVDAMNIAKAAA